MKSLQSGEQPELPFVLILTEIVINHIHSLEARHYALNLVAGLIRSCRSLCEQILQHKPFWTSLMNGLVLYRRVSLTVDVHRRYSLKIVDYDRLTLNEQSRFYRVHRPDNADFVFEILSCLENRLFPGSLDAVGTHFLFLRRIFSYHKLKQIFNFLMEDSIVSAMASLLENDDTKVLCLHNFFSELKALAIAGVGTRKAWLNVCQFLNCLLDEKYESKYGALAKLEACLSHRLALSNQNLSGKYPAPYFYNRSLVYRMVQALPQLENKVSGACWSFVNLTQRRYPVGASIKERLIVPFVESPLDRQGREARVKWLGCDV